jgi:hypothetical protein
LFESAVKSHRADCLIFLRPTCYSHCTESSLNINRSSSVLTGLRLTHLGRKFHCKRKIIPVTHAARAAAKLFEIYFLHSVEYKRAISLVGVAEGTFDFRLGEVKRALGREFARTGLFPPWRYFRVRE